MEEALDIEDCKYIQKSNMYLNFCNSLRNRILAFGR